MWSYLRPFRRDWTRVSPVAREASNPGPTDGAHASPSCRAPLHMRPKPLPSYTSTSYVYSPWNPPFRAFRGAGVGEDAVAVEIRERGAPPVVVVLRRVVDVHVADPQPFQLAQCVDDAARSSPFPRLDVERHPQPRRARSGCDRAQSRVLDRPGAPPGDDHRVDPRRRDLAHLTPEDGLRARRVRPPRRIEVRADRLRRRLAPCPQWSHPPSASGVPYHA